MSAPKNRSTIGFLCANIHIGIGRTLWPGVTAAAKDLGVNLFCFPGGGIGVQARGEVHRNIIFEMANAYHLDGVASWASTLGVELSPAEVAGFHRRFDSLPLVSLSQPIDNVPAVLMDNANGIRSAIFHLLDTHHLRRLALIRGPESHFAAQERYHAYVEALAEREIEIDPNLITPPLRWNDVDQALKILLDERGLVPGRDFDGIIATSDLFALAILKELRVRQIAVPEQVAIIGFNNMPEGRLISPSLTSVELNFYNQGYQAVNELLTIIQGTAGSIRSCLPTTLVTRQSCGCPPQAVLEAALDHPSGHFRPLSLEDPAWEERLRAALDQKITGPAGSQELITAYIHALKSGWPWDFLQTFEAILQQVDARDGDIAAWQGVISCLRRYTLPDLDAGMRSRCENLCGQARVIIGEAVQRAQTYRQLHAERRSETLREIGQALITTFDIETLTDVLVERLPQLGISSCYMALYENPLDPLDSARLILAYTEGKRTPLEVDGLRYPTRQLLPEGLLPAARFSLLVESLYFQQEQIGVVLFEVGPEDGAVYEVLRSQISSALKGALLLQEVQDQKRRLTDSEARLKELSIRDPLTRLYNRRFLEEMLGREILKDARAPLSLGMIMIDIDHFKHFNDTYGHIVGDELLRQLGELFLSHVRGSDVACRFGGEEFVILLPEASLEATQQRAEFLRQAAAQIQVTYNGLQTGCITLSFGVAMFPLHATNRTSLLQAADRALYRAKDEGRNRVVVAISPPAGD